MKKKMIIFLTALLFINSLAYAHEKRAVGEYEFVVGFVNEPAFSGAMNGLDLMVNKNQAPVDGIQTLKASVQFEAQEEKLNLTLKPRYKQPGKYAGYFFPTKPGKYTFYITGKVGETEIDEVFVSGEKFHNIEDVEALKWPK